jgi:hypothetical protein
MKTVTMQIRQTKWLWLGAIFLCYVAWPMLHVQAEIALPVIEKLNARGYIKENGTVFVEESITFSHPVVAKDFVWSVPNNSTEPYSISSNGYAPKGGQIVSTKNALKTIRAIGIETSRNYTITYTLVNSVGTDGDTAFMHWQLINQPTTTILQHTASLTLPNPVPQEAVTARLFTTNNIGRHTVTVSDKQVVNISISGITPQALAGLDVRWPKVGLQTTLLQYVASELSSKGLATLFLTTIAFPFLAFIALVGMIIKNAIIEHIPRVREQRDTPPALLSPTLVGTLVHKQLSHETLLATIFDLAQRGYVGMVEKGGHYSFGRLKPSDASLQPWESALLEQLFSNQGFQVESWKLVRKSRSHLISPYIMTVFETVYGVVTQMGYFRQNPFVIQIRYKLLGLVFYFLSLLSLLYLIATNQPFIIILPATGLFVTSFVIIRFARLMPERTTLGKTTLKEWLRFRSFLKDPNPLPAATSLGNTFFAYLPYAIVFGVEKEWLKRFRQQALLEPSWLMSSEPKTTESFTGRFLEAVTHVSKTFETLRGPTVE